MTQTEHFTDIYDDIYGDPPPIGPSVPPSFETILFPDVIKICVDYLNVKIPPTLPRAHLRVPKVRPEAFITVSRTGGVRQTIVTDGAQVTVDVWAQHEDDAYALAQLVRAHLHAMQATVQQGVTVYGVNEIAGPGLLPDPVSQQPRYVFTLEVVTRGVAALVGS